MGMTASSKACQMRWVASIEGVLASFHIPFLMLKDDEWLGFTLEKSLGSMWLNVANKISVDIKKS